MLPILFRDEILLPFEEQNEFVHITRDEHLQLIDDARFGTRPPQVAGKPEVRRYRLIYILEDEPYGNFSPIYIAVTTPD